MNDQTIRELDESIRLDPEDAATYRNRGIAYRFKGDYDCAISDFDESIQLDPENARVYHNRGIVYRLKGDHRL